MRILMLFSIFLVARTAVPAERPRPVRAMWVWDAESWSTPPARAKLLAFAAQHRISELFLQVAHRGKALALREEIRAFLRDCHERSLLVHALDGYPEGAMRENHEDLTNLAHAVLAYNSGARPEERFHGLHLDVEPYLLTGFDGTQKQRIFQEFLELNEKTAVILAGSGVKIGADIPFWFDGVTVEFHGTKRSVAKHLIDLLDNVGIMDYRNQAAGPDGMIEFARDEVRYASEAGKRLYIGVETAPAEATRKVFLWGLSRAEWSGITPESFPPLFKSRLDGFGLITLEGKTREYVGLTEPEGNSRTEDFEVALQKLQRMLKQPNVSAAQLGNEAQATVRANREYEGYAPYISRKGEQAGFSTTAKATPKITFANMTEMAFEKELSAVAAAFAAEPAFHGFAIHHYGSYRKLKP